MLEQNILSGLDLGTVRKAEFVGSNSIRKTGGVAIGRALTYCRSLRTLNLSPLSSFIPRVGGNRIGKEGGEAIGAALLFNRTLKDLNLGTRVGQRRIRIKRDRRCRRQSHSGRFEG